jgi:hypothetical protein
MGYRLHVLASLFLVGVACTGLASSADRDGTLNGLEIYVPCAPLDNSCPRRHEVRRVDDGYGVRTSSSPIFTTRFPLSWNECVRNREIMICLQLDSRDIDRWNSQFGTHPPRQLAIAVESNVIAVLSVRGAFVNPVAIPQMDGISPPIALESFLKASSAAP